MNTLPDQSLTTEEAEIYRLGKTLCAQKRFGDAEKVFRQLLSRKPDHINSYEYLGMMAWQTGQDDLASTHYRKITTVAPDYPPGYIKLGSALAETGNPIEAIETLEKAVSLEPGNARVHHILATLYLAQNRREDAQEEYRKADTLDPSVAEYFCEYLRHFHKFENLETDPAFARLKAFEAREETLPDGCKIALAAAFAQAYEQVGAYDNAFPFYKKANALKKRKIGYVSGQEGVPFDQAKAYFTEEFLKAYENAGYPDERPVFVMGMPRSGTTLVEQILHAHPQACGIGESPFLSRLIYRRVQLPDMPHVRSPHTPATTDPLRDFREIGRIYGDFLEREAPGASRVVDKAMDLHLWIPLIAVSLPNARFVYCRRNALDSCLSAYTKIFTRDAQSYSYDLESLGRYYRLHTELMAHWKTLLPDRIYEVAYEQLVQDPDTESRKLVAFTGLPWDDRCLEFHKEEKLVRTASVSQVRNPIYKSSLGTWKKYGKHLGPLIEALGSCAPEDVRE